jgi:hypothetical protein
VKGRHDRRLPRWEATIPRSPDGQSRDDSRQPRFAPIPPGIHPACVRSLCVRRRGGGIGYRVDGRRLGLGRLWIEGWWRAAAAVVTSSARPPVGRCSLNLPLTRHKRPETTHSGAMRPGEEWAYRCRSTAGNRSHPAITKSLEFHPEGCWFESNRGSTRPRPQAWGFFLAHSRRRIARKLHTFNQLLCR